jgi:hypothetical protein
MKVAVVGSRGYPTLDAVDSLVDSLPPDTVVVSGGARGVDTRAESRAIRRGLWVESYRVQQVHWNPDRFEVQLHRWVNGEYQGYVLVEEDFDTFASAAYWRNCAIVDIATDRVFAFWDGKSRGTNATILMAEGRGRPMTVFPPFPPRPSETRVVVRA